MKLTKEQYDKLYQAVRLINQVHDELEDAGQDVEELEEIVDNINLVKDDADIVENNE